MLVGQIETATTADGMQYVPGMWSVWRHGGRQTDRWRLVAAVAGEITARDAYQRAVTDMRQGGVELRGPDGTLVLHHWAPRLRTRW